MSQEISVVMPPEIVSVYGTINGVYKDFSLSSPNVWTATVATAIDGKYVMSITSVNSLGTYSTVETTKYILDEPIEFKTDWVATDFFNFTDMNRIEINIAYVHNYIKTNLGIAIPDIVTKQDRTISSVDYLSDLNRIEQNLETIRKAYKTHPLWGGWAIWNPRQPFTYRQANRFEMSTKLLLDMAIEQYTQN